MVGKRVEGDVDLMVDGEMRLESRGPAKEVDPIWVDIALGKTVAELRLKRMIVQTAAFQEQARLRHGAKHARPECQGVVGEFGGVVERPENHCSGHGSRWRRRSRRRDCRQVGPCRGRKPHQPFRVERVGGPWRVGPGVREPDVHRSQACGIGVAKVADLERCDPSGKNGETVEASMPREIDEDVGCIFAYTCFHRGIGPGCEIAPERRMGLQSGTGGVGHNMVVVKHQLELGSIQMIQERLQKIGNRVGAEIRGVECETETSTRDGETLWGWRGWRCF